MGTTAMGAMLVVSCLQAAELRGVVLANEVHGRPVARVGISADQANRTESDADGRYRLEFPMKEPGQTVKVVVAPPAGYEVVNSVQLETRLPDNPGDRPLVVILCTSKTLDDCRRRYYGFRGRESVDEDFQRRRQAHPQDFKALKEERREAQKDVDRIANQLASLEMNGGADWKRRAVRFFLDGDWGAAQKLLASSGVIVNWSNLRKEGDFDNSCTPLEDGLKVAVTARNAEGGGAFAGCCARLAEPRRIQSASLDVEADKAEEMFEVKLENDSGRQIYIHSGRLEPGKRHVQASLRETEEIEVNKICIMVVGGPRKGKDQFNELAVRNVRLVGSADECHGAVNLHKLQLDERNELTRDRARFKRAMDACAMSATSAQRGQWNAKVDGLEVLCQCDN
jgi:hypothetical protein